MELKKNKKETKLIPPAVLDAYQAEPLRDSLLEAIDAKNPVSLELKGVEKLDTLCSQVMVAAQISCNDRDLKFALKNPSEACTKTFRALGLEDFFFNNDGKDA